ncbi:uncharacterized protein ATNIH1004_000571 [Aspergillus tanneri]|uniref:Uncharacterized protein n=1 Tax=Aspergillus tanneri TaxID=1220188 RepID=A0A5M9MX53_9EURO|nr:uncharacterized protein ATNIH1004_000571 [Aspergillus tanneri]KAA8651675.1 hypothetical protein ATNIH1004_000571 [Aspergillus tanneri]
MEILNQWLKETRERVGAAVTAYSNHQVNKNYQFLFISWLGNFWSSNNPDPLKSEARWLNMNRHMDAVRAFINRDSVSGVAENPYLFCGDGSAQHYDCNSAVEGPDDQPIKGRENPPI